MGCKIDASLFTQRAPVRANGSICIAGERVNLILGCAQVPIEGEKEGGVEWVADQAAITVQELREVRNIEIQVFRFL